MLAAVIRRALGLVWLPLGRLIWSDRGIGLVGAVLARLPARDYRVEVDGLTFRASAVDRFLALLMWKYGVLEAYELELMRAMIKPGMSVVDVGANIGFHTLQMARATGVAGRVVAFEPSPGNLFDLRRNVDANNASQVTLMPMAVSDTVGTTQLLMSRGNGGDHRIIPTAGARDSIAVPTTTLDAWCDTSGVAVDVIKIDAQGAEHLVLKGMRAMLERRPDVVIFLEFTPALLRDAAIDPADVATAIVGTGRRVQIIDHERRRCVDASAGELVRLAAASNQIDLLLTRNPQAPDAAAPVR